MVSMATKCSIRKAAGNAASLGADESVLTPNRSSINGVKMVLPFERQPLLHKRYTTLSSPELTRFYPAENDESPKGDEYANFLK